MKKLLPIVKSKDHRESPQRLCPSFSPLRPGTGWVFGVVDGDLDHPEVLPLEEPEPVTQEIFDMVAPFHPSQVFRMTAPCIEGRCKNFGQGKCHLAKTVVAGPEATDRLRPCSIRQSCLWWHQEGKDACMRCPGVVTNNSKSKAIRDEMGR